MENPPPAERLLEMMTGKWLTHLIGAAADLGIADHLDRPRTIEELARRLDAHPDSLRRLLRALAGVGVFRQADDGRYALTPLAEPLRSGEGSLRSFALMLSAPYMNRAWERLGWAVRTGRDPFEDLHGTDLFAYLEKSPEDARVFDEAMTAHVGEQAQAVVAAYDFAALRRVVDVGGGHGTLLAAILRANPRAHGVLFDLPRVAEGAAARLAEAGLSGRSEAVGGDFFQSVPGGGDAYILSFVIHDWGDEPAAAILRNVGKAMPRDSRLLLVEYVLPEGNEPHFGKLLDVEMMVGGGSGRERTEAEYRGLLGAAGFSVERLVPTPSGATVIEARRA